MLFAWQLCRILKFWDILGSYFLESLNLEIFDNICWVVQVWAHLLFPYINCIDIYFADAYDSDLPWAMYLARVSGVECIIQYLSHGAYRLYILTTLQNEQCPRPSVTSVIPRPGWLRKVPIVLECFHQNLFIASCLEPPNSKSTGGPGVGSGRNSAWSSPVPWRDGGTTDHPIYMGCYGDLVSEDALLKKTTNDIQIFRYSFFASVCEGLRIVYRTNERTLQVKQNHRLNSGHPNLSFNLDKQHKQTWRNINISTCKTATDGVVPAWWRAVLRCQGMVNPTTWSWC